MFTPPPSPLPPKTVLSPEPEEEDDENFKPDSYAPRQSPTAAKRETARRTKWAVVMLPLALILITLSSRYFTRPRTLDLKSSNFAALDWQNWGSHRETHHRHRRATSTPVVAATSAAAPSPATSGSSVSQTLPTIPSTPPTLPTPFPQAFDTSLTRNFSTQSCYNFFANMTSTAAFRSCRPFSLLLQSSEAFISAQSNITQLNSIIWGTCNTSLGQDQCNDNMAWFTSALKSECASDLKDNNAVTVETLQALQAFTVMSQAACLADPSTNAYCYVKAVVNSNPSDLYFYSLPLGTTLPASSSPSCSACTKSLMGLYADAMKTTDLDGLKETYTGAAEFANKACGAGYAQTNANSNSGLRRFEGGALLAMLCAMMVGILTLRGMV